MSLRVSLEVTSNVQREHIDPASPTYDPAGNEVNLVFTNESASAVEFPAHAIVQGVVRTYRDTETGASEEFTISDPPMSTAKLTRLAAGESWTYRLGFEYPATLLERRASKKHLEICANWSSDELDRGIYADGSYDWAESFNACYETTVFD